MSTAEINANMIPILELRPSKTNPRKLFDKKQMQELIASVTQSGVITPLLVRVHGPDPDERAYYEIVDGERRYRAAKAAGLTELPCVERELTDAEVLEAQVVANDQRADVHPLEQAHAYERLMKVDGYDTAKIAARVGRSESFVYQRLKLAELVPKAQDMFLGSVFDAGHAILIARLTDAQQREVVKWFANRNEWSVRQLANEIQRQFHLRLKDAPFDITDAKLVKAAGSCVECPKRSGANKLLFSDITEDDTCTDLACYENKVETFVQVQISSNPEARKLTSGYKYNDPKGAMGWTRAGNKTCPALQMGVVVEATNQQSSEPSKRGKLGEVFKVCTDPKCKVHHVAVKREVSNPRSSAENIKERKRRIELRRRRIVFQAVVRNASDPGKDQWINALKFVIDSLTNDHAKAMCEALEWVPPHASSGKYNFREIIHRKLGKTDATYWVPIVALAGTELWYWPQSSMGARTLDGQAKRCKLSLASFAKAAAAKPARKVKAVAKKAKSKKK